MAAMHASWQLSFRTGMSHASAREPNASMGSDPIDLSMANSISLGIAMMDNDDAASKRGRSLYEWLLNKRGAELSSTGAE